MKFKLYENKSSIFKPKCRMVLGGLSEIRGNKIAWWERFVLEEDTTDKEFVIDHTYAKRPDRLSKLLYGTSEYAHVLLQFNHIVDIDEEFIYGKTIRYPTRERLLNLRQQRT